MEGEVSRRTMDRIVSVLLLAVGACSPAADAPTIRSGAGETRNPSGPLVVYVVNYPLLYFAERIGGTAVQAEFPAPPLGDPTDWQPEPARIAEYQAADLIVRNGATYAKWIDLVTLPESKVVGTSTRFADRFITVEDATTHSHGPEGEHTHGEIAFTAWLDPLLAIEQARAIHDAFVAARRKQEADFDTNFAALQSDLEALDARLVSLTRNAGDAPLLASHPVYQYFARRYGLNLESVHFEPDEMPDEAAWRALEQLVASHPARWMIWEGQPSDDIVDRLMSMGIGSVVYDPAGNRPADGDFLAVMQQNVLNLQAIFSREYGAHETPDDLTMRADASPSIRRRRVIENCLPHGI